MTATAEFRDTKCAKCFATDLAISWHGDGDEHPTRRLARCRRYGEDRGHPTVEHLHYTCRTCQYTWTGPVAT
jgi:hypothetical protein